MVMKVAKEQKREKKPKKEKIGGNLADVQIDRNLFERLRALRLEIAKEERVPPYIVFSDKTLIHMCQLMPKTKEDMMQVSGVGEMKFAKYGQRFLEAIQ